VIVHYHAFSDVREANAFICAINWVNSVDIEDINREVIFEPIDIEVGTDDDDKPIASAIVNEYEPGDEDEDAPDGYAKEFHDHREHVSEERHSHR
jgi:hypothetical protein